MFERFTEPACRLVAIASEESRRLGDAHIGTGHLLLGARRAGGAAGLALTRLGAGEGRLQTALGLEPSGETVEGAPSFTSEARAALATAARISLDGGGVHVGTRHIVLALLQDPPIAAALATLRIDESRIRFTLETLPPDLEPLPAEPPRGELGDPRADALLLRAIVERRGPVANWLAERGVDAAAVDALLHG